MDWVNGKPGKKINVKIMLTNRVLIIVLIIGIIGLFLGGLVVGIVATREHYRILELEAKENTYLKDIDSLKSSIEVELRVEASLRDSVLKTALNAQKQEVATKVIYERIKYKRNIEIPGKIQAINSLDHSDVIREFAKSSNEYIRNSTHR